VTQTTPRGEIVLEAAVNTDGDVTSVRTLTNTTGSMGLEAKNRAELEGTKFYPIVQKGQRVPFTYEYRVHY
jgi:outer membrane biosynthesis protein TonB